MKVAEVYCNYSDCRFHTLAECANDKCDCCDLEDALMIISRAASAEPTAGIT